MSSQTVVFVEEEYGYRIWLWTYPGTKEELVADWKAGKAPLNFFNPSQGSFGGKMEEIGIDVNLTALSTMQDTADAYAHVHMDDDTYLEIDGETHWPPGHKEEVQ